jgi:4'-phosphopantetheinyl transferase
MRRDAAEWGPPPREPHLEAAGVHVWRIALRQTASARSSVERTLDPDERARAMRFVFVDDRERFVVAHGALRDILARTLACQPESVRFSASASGKPAIAWPTDPGVGALHFNLAHSQDLALVALTRRGSVGVDVERVRPEIEIDALAERFFTPTEWETLRAMPLERRTGHFYRLWTCKEAYLKATGMGITAGLDRVEVAFPADDAPRLTVLDEGGRDDRGASDERGGASDEGPRQVAPWSLVELAPGVGYVGALALRGAVASESVALWEWDAARA